MIQLGPGMYQHAQMKCRDCSATGMIIKHKCKVCKAEKIVVKEKMIEVPIGRGVPNDYDYVLTGEGHETVRFL